MHMDYELHTAVNAKIAEIITKAKQDYGCDIDMIISQTDKYENSRDESVVYGLGCSKGLKSERYYFNAISDETSEFFKLAVMYYNEPVSFYENVGTVDRFGTGGCMVYRIQVDTFRRHIVVYEVGYGCKNEPVYTKIETIDLKPSKYLSKIKVGV